MPIREWPEGYRSSGGEWPAPARLGLYTGSLRRSRGEGTRRWLEDAHSLARAAQLGPQWPGTWAALVWGCGHSSEPQSPPPLPCWAVSAFSSGAACSFRESYCVGRPLVLGPSEAGLRRLPACELPACHPHTRAPGHRGQEVLPGGWAALPPPRTWVVRAFRTSVWGQREQCRKGPPLEWVRTVATRLQ